MKRTELQVALIMLVVASGCDPTKPAVGDAGDAGEALDADAGLTGDGGFTGDAGLFELGTRRDAGPLFLDHGLPWSWASVQEVLSIPPTGGAVTSRWVGVRPYAVDRAWSGGVLLFDGGVVGIPFNEATVLKINTVDDTSERWPVTGGAVEEGWQGGVLLPDGTVIAFPRNADRFLRIDPATRTAAPFGDDLSDTGADGGLDKFRGGVLGLNGLVYAAPSTATFIARLDPATGTITRLPLPPTAIRGSTQGAVVFPTGDIAMFPSFDMPGLLIIPSRDGGTDEVWFLARPAVLGPAAFTGSPVITSFETAVAPPQQNAMPLRYDAALIRWDAPIPGVSPQSANGWFFGAWSTNGHIYAPPFGVDGALRLTTGAPTEWFDFDTDQFQFRSWSGAVGLPDGRILSMPHSRSSWLELSPAGRRSLPLEAFTSPFLNKL